MTANNLNQREVLAKMRAVTKEFYCGSCGLMRPISSEVKRGAKRSVCKTCKQQIDERIAAR